MFCDRATIILGEGASEEYGVLQAVGQHCTLG